MYQGSHVPNFEALGVPKSKCQARTHTQTTTTTPHHPIVKDFFETFTKKVPLENVPRVPCVKYLSPRMNRKKTADNHRHTDTDRQTDGGDDNT